MKKFLTVSVLVLGLVVSSLYVGKSADTAGKRFDDLPTQHSIILAGKRFDDLPTQHGIILAGKRFGDLPTQHGIEQNLV